MQFTCVHTCDSSSFLLLLFMADFVNGLPCDVVSFADDAAIWRTVEAPSGVQDLQKEKLVLEKRFAILRCILDCKHWNLNNTFS